MQELNWISIFLATIISFILGAIWHGPIFGKQWMKIHFGDKKSNEINTKENMKGIWKLMLTEFISTFFMIIGLACIIREIPEYSGERTAFMVWLAFILTTMTSTIIWGGDEKKWMIKKIAISSSARLLSLIIAGYILNNLSF